ncbi:hypothetical protein E2C01_004944 [Portunus trituberculatus]|uniref:Uncharacterized protein n=1 Tax=Portunus trituberculatus TaxID=210409 RepID=A0A5B7CTP6_PORTR|nr:hypothetical protein [Portunus trituberculatus]
MTECAVRYGALSFAEVHCPRAPKTLKKANIECQSPMRSQKNQSSPNLPCPAPPVAFTCPALPSPPAPHLCGLSEGSGGGRAEEGRAAPPPHHSLHHHPPPHTTTARHSSPQHSLALAWSQLPSILRLLVSVAPFPPSCAPGRMSRWCPVRLGTQGRGSGVPGQR